MFEVKIKQVNTVIEQIDLLLGSLKNPENALGEESLLGFQNYVISQFEENIKSMRQALIKKKRYVNESKVDEYIENLGIIRTKLKSYVVDLNVEEEKMNSSKNQIPQINIHNTNTNTNNNTNNNDAYIKILFDEARSKIENDQSMSEEDINEVLEKINEVENISNLNEPNNKKWFKLKPTMEWVLTKGLTTGTAVLSLITAILKAK